MPNPNLEDQGLSFVRPLSLDQSGTVEPNRAYVPTGIALGVIEACKLHHHNKVTSPEWRTHSTAAKLNNQVIVSLLMCTCESFV